MAEKECEREEARHREVVQHYREQIKKESALVERLHGEALERRREQEEQGRALVEQLHREALERSRAQPPSPPPEPQTVHYLDQPEPRPGDQLFAEWTSYRREAGRLLGEGREGKYLLIKGAEIVGIWDTQEDATAEGYDRYGHQPFLVHQLREREPVLRCISVRLCGC
ncbi:MAG TPA: hypothetical protein VG013_00335 [Gemmataceae bacterium]|jgi:hypothetical protein|nr:hypothetical protein [Gemmataceae bacterium]